MKRSIVLYYHKSPAERDIIRALENGGFTVMTARSVEAMHTLFTEQEVFAAVIPRSLARTHHIGVGTHLCEAHSSMTVICWEQRPDRSIATTIFTAREHSFNTEQMRKNRRQALQAALLVRAAGTQHITRYQEPPETISWCHDPPDLPDLPGIHRKMRSILDAIARSGPSGATAEAIAGRIWPDSAQNRTRDLQSYISKLRKIIEKENNMPVRISYRNRRYRLTMHDQ